MAALRKIVTHSPTLFIGKSLAMPRVLLKSKLHVGFPNNPLSVNLDYSDQEFRSFTYLHEKLTLKYWPIRNTTKFTYL